MAKTIFKWEIFIKENELWVMLNGGVNKVFDMDHKSFEANKQAMKDEIKYFESFTRTTIKGAELLD